MIQTSATSQDTTDTEALAIQTATRLITEVNLEGKPNNLSNNSVMIDLIFEDNLSKFFKIADTLEDKNIFKELAGCLKLPVIDTKSDCYYNIQQSPEDSWQARHNKFLSQAILYLRKYEYSLGLEYASKTLKNLPVENTKEIDNAAYEAYYVLHVGYLYDYDVRGLLEAVNKTIEHSNKADRSFNIYNVLYNIAKMFSELNNDDLAIQIVSTALPLSDSANQQDKFITNYSMGSFLIKQKKYKEAIPFLEISSNTELQPYSRAIVEIALAEANVFTGDIKATDRNLKNIYNLLPVEQVNGSYLKDQILLVKSEREKLIGNYKGSHRLLTEYSDARIEKLSSTLSRSRIDISKRVKAQQAQTDLANQALQEKEKGAAFKQKVNKLALTIMVILIIVSLLAMVHFLRLTNLLKISRNKIRENSQFKSKLLSMFSHEMMTPLNGIIPLVDVMVRRNNDPDQHKVLSTINKSANTLHNKLANIMIVSGTKDIEYSPEDISIKSYAQNLLKKINTRYDINKVKLNVQELHQNTITTLDSQALDKVLFEIIGNAFKFSNDKSIEIDFLVKLKSLSIIITDQGNGIDISNIDNLTDLFEQNDTGIRRKYDGIGLGLSVVKTYLKLFHGTIEFRVNEHNGTVVTITIPNCIKHNKKLAA